MELSKIENLLICPQTKSDLIVKGNKLISINNERISYEIFKGIPILINQKNTIFELEKIKKSFDEPIARGSDYLKKQFLKFMPILSKNYNTLQKTFSNLNGMLKKDDKVLIIGGTLIGEGSNIIYNNKQLLIISTDINWSSNVDIINDATELCFKDETFDCVIIQAVLEHVLEPQVCVKEIHRVLKKEGLVYAETAFMQQVHARQYDFTRYTFLGHKWLFKNFTELESGVICGTGMALAWSLNYFLKSLFKNKFIINLLHVFSSFLFFPFKYLDKFTINNKGSYDAASGFYFIGKKSEKEITKKELINSYKGS